MPCLTGQPRDARLSTAWHGRAVHETYRDAGRAAVGVLGGATLVYIVDIRGGTS